MGLTLEQPSNLTWEEWMCELMCGSVEEEEDDRTVEVTRNREVPD